MKSGVNYLKQDKLIQNSLLKTARLSKSNYVIATLIINRDLYCGLPSYFLLSCKVTYQHPQMGERMHEKYLFYSLLIRNSV